MMLEIAVAIGLLSTPALGPNPIVPRDYQLNNLEKVRSAFKSGYDAPLSVLATGTGKTVCIGLIARSAIEKGKRVLITCPTRHLVDQTANKLDEMGVEPGVEMASRRARSLYEPDVVVATTATLHQSRLEEFDKSYFDLIILDEAHHAVTMGTRRILTHFSQALVAGYTATHDRADGEDVGQIFDCVAHEFNLWQAMTAPDPGPYLSRITFLPLDLGIDLRDLRTKDGDFTNADLERRIQPMVEVLSNAIRQETEGRSTLVFTPMIASAQAMASGLRHVGLNADWVSGDDPHRESKIKKFNNGDLQYLCNAVLLTEGVDLPRTSAIALLRPTKSRTLYSQVLGRGTRLFPGKSECLVIDPGFVTQQHDLVVPAELCVGSGMDSEVLVIAHELMKKNKKVDLVEAVEEAEKIHSERPPVKVKAQFRHIAYKRVAYDPLSMADAIGMPWHGSRVKDSVVDRATPRQVELLNKFKIQDAANLSKTRANTLLSYLFSRRKSGLATPAQVSHAIASGMDPAAARNMTIGAASEYLSNLWGHK